MNRYAFEKLARHSLRRLPRKFKQRLKNISIEIEDSPSAALLREMQIESGTLFGLYRGVPLTEREWNYGNVLPDRIVIYQRPIEAAAISPDQVEEIVMDTVMHEIGHYFGFNDDTLNSIELEKREDRRRRQESKKG
jgi:predicted Zn-dependent protease with MMP-like domain